MTKNDLGTSCNYHYGKLFTEKVDTIVFKTILEEKKYKKTQICSRLLVFYELGVGVGWGMLDVRLVCEADQLPQLLLTN